MPSSAARKATSCQRLPSQVPVFTTTGSVRGWGPWPRKNHQPFVAATVAAKEESVTLPLWKPQNRVANDGPAFVGGGHGFSADLLRLHLHPRGGSIQVLSGVDDASRDPRVERS